MPGPDDPAACPRRSARDHRRVRGAGLLFLANQDRLTVSRPSYLLEVGDGNRDSVSNLCSKLDEGPRGWEAGEVAEQIRRLRVRYGEE